MSNASTNRTIADSPITWDAFGGFLQRMRKQRGLSQDALCKLLNCHRTHVYRLEHGSRRPSRIFVRLLAQVCAPSMDEAAMLQGFEQLHEFHCDSLEYIHNASSVFADSHKVVYPPRVPDGSATGRKGIPQ